MSSLKNSDKDKQKKIAADNDETKKKELEEQIRQRVSSEERAFRIVLKLAEETVPFDRLKDMAHYLMPTHYQDICEERAIAKLCGYPICTNNMPNTKPKTYHISTKTNKVYDITERKNFCSNHCFKHSKIFEKQVLTSPLWIRSKEQPAKFHVPTTANDKGWIGYEVIGKNDYWDIQNISDEEDTNDAEEEDSKGVLSILDRRDWLDALHDSLCGSQPNVPKLSAKDSDIDEDPFHQHADYEEGSEGYVLQLEGSDEEYGSTTSGSILEGLQSNISELANLYSDETDSDDGPQVVTSRKKKMKAPKKEEESKQQHLPSMSAVPDDKAEKTSPHSQINQLKTLLDKRKNKLTQFVNPVSLVNNDPESSRTDKEGNHIGRHHSSGSQTSDTVSSCSNASPSTKDNSKDVGNSNPQQPRDKIIKFIQSWITPDSLKFLGVSNSEEHPDPSNDSASKTDSEFSKLCDRVAIQGQDFELLLDDHVPQKDTLPKKSLPSYEILQKETESYSFKVKEYFKPIPPKKADENDESEMKLVLPNVDSYCQVTLRRSIFLEQLGRKITSLISYMDLLIGELSTDIKDLIHSFSLVNTNIVLKTREWDIAAIFIIILLSKKTAKLETGLQKPKVREKFNDILQKFDLTLPEAETLVTEKLLVL